MVLAVPAPITFTVGQILTAGQLNTNLRDAINFAINPPLFQGTVTATQSIANIPSPFVDILWDTNVIDTYSGHSTSVNTARYTAPVNGFYRINGKLAFVPNSAGIREIGLAKNGTLLPNTIYVAPAITATMQASTTTTVVTDFILQLNAGEYVTVQAYQNSGGVLNLSPSVCRFDVIWVHA